MIEPTDEMVQAFNGADFSGLGPADWEDAHVRAGLAAVLPIVERDQTPTADAYDAAVRALEKHRRRADRAEDALGLLTSLVGCAEQLDPSERHFVMRAEGCGWCGGDHLAELTALVARLGPTGGDR